MLVPLSWLFAAISALRRFAYKVGILKSYQLPVPVIVVGNINMGGNGKTPVVMWLVKQLRSNGYQPAVISRGYGGAAKLPTQVKADSKPSDVGDEPILIANKCACPVWVGANKVQVATELLKVHPEINILISDDGLQHYALHRDIEIAVTQPEQLTYKPRLLPAGPMRESLERLNTVDAIVCNGEKTKINEFEMQLVGEQFYNLLDPEIKAGAAYFKRKTIKALAGIGKPERFFEHLSQLGLAFASVSFDDHHAFTAQDLANIDCDVLIMTEKDAIKCKAFAKPHHWVLPVQAEIEEGLLILILNKLAKN